MANSFSNQLRWRTENPLKRSIISAFSKARKRAVKANVPFEIPKGTTNILFERCGGKCELSGIPFRTTNTGVCSMFSPSIDRKDPLKGYTIDNVRVILHGLNALKGSGTDDELLLVCSEVAKRFNDDEYAVTLNLKVEAEEAIKSIEDVKVVVSDGSQAANPSFLKNKDRFYPAEKGDFRSITGSEALEEYSGKVGWVYTDHKSVRDEYELIDGLQPRKDYVYYCIYNANMFISNMRPTEGNGLYIIGAFDF